MTLRPLHLSRNDPRSWRTAAVGLLLAAAIVGLAIVVGGATARPLNAIGAVLWLASGVLLAVSLPSVQRSMLGWVAAIAGGFILGAVVRPGISSRSSSGSRLQERWSFWPPRTGSAPGHCWCRRSISRCTSSSGSAAPSFATAACAPIHRRPPPSCRWRCS